MASKQYSARDLLRLKHLPPGQLLYYQLYEKLREDIELAEIFRMPPDRQLHLIEEESGDISGGGSDECGATQSSVARQLDGTDSEWKYRGRNDSEHAEIQPISAPTGLVAQKDEGFQRFYKAVVSPTHVRVTAGGRIVPNTRGSSSPTAKWSKEKISGDGTYHVRPPSCDHSEQGSFPHAQAPFGSFAPMFPAFHHAVPQGMTTGHGPFPVMPWHMGFNMGNGFVVPPHHVGHRPDAKATTKSVVSSKSDKKSDVDATENTGSFPVSPPEQFDHSRPYFYNNQWIMPPGHPHYTYGMAMMPGYPAPPAAAPALGSQRMGVSPMVYQQTAKTGPYLRPQMAHASSSSLSSGLSLVTPSNPPISSIRPSDITKKQIDMLRGSLRYLEDQLQYNKHQIDEKETEKQAQVVRLQIQQFEKNVEGQLAFEQSHYPRHERNEDANKSADSQASVQPKSSIASETKSGTDYLSNSGSQDEPEQKRVSKSKPRNGKGASLSKPSTVMNCARSASAQASVSVPELPGTSKTVRKLSTLPVSAALAPPFQPRKDKQFSGELDLTAGATPTEVSDQISGLNKTVSGLHDDDSRHGPYLVGHLPRGINPNHAQDTDYIYIRDLTEDELRARHMYWGKAPRNLQSGLPKFDGKDFYPPSPVRESSSRATSSPALSSQQLPIRISGVDHVEHLYAKPKADFDPFRSVPRSATRYSRHAIGISTQSESLPRAEPSSGSDTGPPPLQRHGSCATQVGRSYDEFRKAMEEAMQTPSDTSKGKSDEAEGDEDSNLLFKGRKAMSRALGTKTRNDIWQTVLKKGKSSANVVPGTVSSMTAHGVLPHYAGHATASLTPTIANASASPRYSIAKFGVAADARSPSPAMDNRRENQPLVDTDAR